MTTESEKELKNFIETINIIDKVSNNKFNNSTKYFITVLEPENVGEVIMYPENDVEYKEDFEENR